ncbi:uncharacterized protein TM35_000161760 [Trypanosoma theileri]|uniref:Uncharacterized protein n=1 Tax=Trypanosoma theileri TaxID=67003 RepID=A0A1X0NVG8_9TRYP|nr:uncharacterized protein TM35_000161760 [Trypanosoma theileri]ORC88538.1 hypothetical protein TM35_000161760 [Trypanosoma theileri]
MLVRDHHKQPHLTTSSPRGGTGKNSCADIVMASPVSKPCEGAVIGEDYVRMLMQTIRNHDGEKLALLQRIDECIKPEYEESQRLRGEVNEKEKKLGELERELSENRLMLQEERERADRLLYENTVLHAQAEEDRKRIASFLQLHRPSNEGFAAVTGVSPSTATATTGRSRSLHGNEKKQPLYTSLGKNNASIHPQKGKGGSGNSNIGGGGGGGGVDGGTMSLRQAVRNQHSTGEKDASFIETNAALQEMALPTSPSLNLVSALKEEVHMLQEQLDAQRSMYEHERAKRVDEERERTRCHEDIVSQHLSTISRLQKLHQTTLADLIRYRHDSQIEQRELRGTVEGLRASVAEANAALQTERRRHASDLQRAMGRRGDDSVLLLQRLRHELDGRRAAAAAVAERHASVLAAREAEVRRLRAALRRSRRRQQRAEERHRLELHGVSSEVSLMRQALRAMEKRVYYSHGRCLDA